MPPDIAAIKAKEIPATEPDNTPPNLAANKISIIPTILPNDIPIMLMLESPQRMMLNVKNTQESSSPERPGEDLSSALHERQTKNAPALERIASAMRCITFVGIPSKVTADVKKTLKRVIRLKNKGFEMSFLKEPMSSFIASIAKFLVE